MLIVPRKNGKTTLIGGLATGMLVIDCEAAPEIYCAAAKKDQAKLCWRDAKYMVKALPLLSKRIQIYKGSMAIEETAGILEPISSNSDKQDGLGPSFVAADETHAWPFRDLWEVLVTGMGARQQPAIAELSTAGFDQTSVCFQNLDYLMKILEGFDQEGGFNDDSVFGLYYTIDEKDDWTSEEIWKKANPNWGISVFPDFLRSSFKKTLIISEAKNNFQTKHLNMWITSDKRWLDMDHWAQCKDKFTLMNLRRRRCFGGLDLSKRLDLTAFSMCFPPLLPETSWKFIIRIYLPEENIDEKAREDRAPYRFWSEKGWLCLTPGNVVDYDFILRDIERFQKIFEFKSIGYDPYNASMFVSELQKRGLPMIEIRQGVVTMSAPAKDFEMLLVGHKLGHNFNPVLRWCCSNAVVRRDANDNYMPDKAKSRGKIDALTACLIAMATAPKVAELTSIYDDQEVKYL